MDLEEAMEGLANWFGLSNNKNNNTIKNKQQNQITINMTNGHNISYNKDNKRWYKNNKVIDRSKYYFYDKKDKCYKVLTANGTTSIAPRYVDTGKPIVPKIITGNNRDAQIEYFRQYPVQDVVIRQIAKNTDTNFDLLKSRNIAEGVIDANIQLNNKKVKQGLPIYDEDPLDYWDNPAQVHNAYTKLGMDDTGTWYKEGKIKLPKNTQVTVKDTINAHGRPVQYLQGRTNRDNLTIMSAALKYLYNVMKRKYPNASENELNARTSAAYQYGITGVDKIKTEKYLKENYTSQDNKKYSTISPDFHFNNNNN